MEGEKKSLKMAEMILLNTFVTLLILSGTLFIFRDSIKTYLLSDTIPTNKAETVITTEKREPLVEMVASVNDAVVSIVITKDVPVYEQYYEQFDPWGFFNVPRIRESGTEEREVGGGSGFIVSNDGLIVTNNHVVVDPNARYSVLLNDGTVYTVEMLARDADLDIAILKINQPIESKLTYLEFGDSTDLKLGQTVVAIGNALAEFQNSVSVGVVSGLSRSIVASDEWGRSEQLDQVIQTDAAINPGNSGGPLLNLEGKVVGVNVATSRGADNIGFALPVAVVKQAVDSVKEFGEIVRPYIGVRYTSVTPRLVKANNLPVDYGALIVRGQNEDEVAVMPDSPAADAGLAENDIILSIDGESLLDKDLTSALRTKKVGQSVVLEIMTNGGRKTVTVTLEKGV
ncbi:MAG: trypsin-like peptidase domain-containing protein [Candidatus Pacebacteria bacterium]|nr:trypsin-like peptidase domain-containing protein [Candidatus Paceibacterota bacterium]MBP9842762.1 trypsin-like peptidase domain-containing protein [Candidatus Paceibacterota bacterium]